MTVCSVDVIFQWRLAVLCIFSTQNIRKKTILTIVRKAVFRPVISALSRSTWICKPDICRLMDSLLSACCSSSCCCLDLHESWARNSSTCEFSLPTLVRRDPTLDWIELILDCRRYRILNSGDTSGLPGPRRSGSEFSGHENWQNLHKIILSQSSPNF